MEKKEAKKGFFAKLMEKLDKKLEEKAKKNTGCCLPKEGDGGCCQPEEKDSCCG